MDLKEKDCKGGRWLEVDQDCHQYVGLALVMLNL